MITAKMLLTYFLQTVSIVSPDVDVSGVDINQAYCLAKNVYYESRSEDIKGQFAVASVTINRVNDERWPDTVCGVVRQITISNKSKKKVCAFSWYCEKDKGGKDIAILRKDGTINQRVVDQFQVATMVAITTLAGSVDDNTRGATHFHNPFTSDPAWRFELTRTMRVGNHDFYR